ncbi:MAG TPA: hypothetical protein VHP81_00115, partial [Lachnospiraceae bacterium]|nr:hypothetical protein [Lachnospiraceae bacterium]
VIFLFSEFIFFMLRKYKFKLPPLTYNRPINIVMSISVVVCMNVNRLLLVIPFTICVINEVIAVRREISQKSM